MIFNNLTFKGTKDNDRTTKLSLVMIIYSYSVDYKLCLISPLRESKNNGKMKTLS